MEYYCLTRWFNTIKPSQMFELCKLESLEEDKAWEEIEESCSNTNNQNWLLNLEQIEQLKKVLK